MNIYYHADDYGVTTEQSKDILDCFINGRLNSVSIILNSPDTYNSYQMIKNYVADGQLRCVAHLNFVEGKSMTQDWRNDVPHLVNHDSYHDGNYGGNTDSNHGGNNDSNNDGNNDGNRDGNLTCTFRSLLMAGYGPARDTIKNELKNEIRSQLGYFAELTESKTISIDSHQHFHMIPIVWDALKEVVDEAGYDVKYIRIPVDPVEPIKRSGATAKVSCLNYTKWCVLQSLKGYATHNWIAGAHAPTFFGIPFTCRMTEDVVDSLIEEYIDVATRRGTDLEIMFHPGAVRNTEQLLDSNNRALVDFYASPYRDLEKQTLMRK